MSRLITDNNDRTKVNLIFSSNYAKLKDIFTSVAVMSDFPYVSQLGLSKFCQICRIDEDVPLSIIDL